MKNIIFAILFLSTPKIALCDPDIKFVTQILEPLGGKIEMPEKWFYRERHGGPVLMWILSEENSDKGPYNTGVRIQMLSGIKEGTGKSAEQFMKEFYAKKRNSVKVLSDCTATTKGLFTRLCLETLEVATEGTKLISHIQYSLFWNNNMDLAVVVTAGTSEELWGEKQKIFKKMEDFELIDMKRFENLEKPGPGNGA